jgi:TubC N-terminal docking domain
VNDMTALIAELEAADIRLRVADGRLLVDAPPGVVTADVRTLLCQHRDALLADIQRRERVAFDTWAGPLYRAVWDAARERWGSAAPAPHAALEQAIDTADREMFERELRELWELRAAVPATYTPAAACIDCGAPALPDREWCPTHLADAIVLGKAVAR